jgi:drug/metabolite transporter (DMT)-like permease
VPAILLALAAAVLNATGDVLQRRGARGRPGEPTGSRPLLARLIRRPCWVVGLLASLGGLVIHVVALSLGTLAAIQPVLVLELPLAVLAASWFSSSRLTRRDWTAVLLMAAGLAVFVSSLSPGAGHPLEVGAVAWVAGLGVLLALVVALALVGRRATGDRRGLALGVAAGVGYGATAVLFAAAGAAAARDGVAVLGSWQPWAAAAFGALSFSLLQHGLAAGKLVAAAPGLTLANPLVAVAWGVLVFGEQPRTGLWLVGAALGAVGLTVGTVLLTRSPLLAGDGSRGGAAAGARTEHARARAGRRGPEPVREAHVA